MPPRPPSLGPVQHRLPVRVHADIRDVLKIQELAGIWQCKVEFELHWHDQRLQFQNLKDNNNLNILTEEERHDIWIPEV